MKKRPSKSASLKFIMSTLSILLIIIVIVLFGTESKFKTEGLIKSIYLNESRNLLVKINGQDDRNINMGEIKDIMFEPSTKNMIVILESKTPFKQPNVKKTQSKQNTPNLIRTYYAVQVLSSLRKDINDIEVRKWKKYITIHKNRNRYQYVIGKCNSYSDAKKLNTKLAEDFPNSFIVAYNGNTKISLGNAKAKLKK